MRYLPRLTLVESVAILGIVAILAAIVLIPDSATSTRWELQRRARDWKQTTVPSPADSSLLAAHIDLAGEWINQQRLTGSSFVFTRRSGRQYDVQFATGGCLGGCKMSRTATVRDGVTTLSSAVAEYLPRTYNTLYMVRVDDADYLVPADGIRDFENELTSGSDGWKRYVFSRRDQSNEPDGG